eukprot:1743189-Rhodomonas_salina.1
MARDHIRRKQGNRADTNADSMQPANSVLSSTLSPTIACNRADTNADSVQPWDKVLLSTEHNNLQLPSEKLAHALLPDDSPLPADSKLQWKSLQARLSQSLFPGPILP